MAKTLGSPPLHRVAHQFDVTWLTSISSLCDVAARLKQLGLGSRPHEAVLPAVLSIAITATPVRKRSCVIAEQAAPAFVLVLTSTFNHPDLYGYGLRHDALRRGTSSFAVRPAITRCPFHVHL